MKKVLFMIPNLGHGGAEKVLVNLVNHMDQDKFQITVMTLYDEGVNKQFLKEGIIYKSCMKKSFKGVSHVLKLWSSKALYHRYVKEHYDYVISYLEGQTARIISGCDDPDTKKLCWIHVEQHTLKRAAALFRGAKEMQRCYRSFDQIVCVSEYVKHDFENIVALPKPAIVLYNTVESDKILELSDEAICDAAFKDNEFKLCGIGTLKTSKGFDRLIRIHSKLINQGYRVHTYILGEGEQESKLKKQAEDCGCSESVTFLGYKNNPYKYTAACDLFVCTSHAEGFSTAATEALIVGTPVLTTRVSGMEEMLGSNGEYGLIADTEDELYEKIRMLIDDRDLLRHYAEQAKGRGKYFSMENTVRAVEEMLTGLN